MKTNKRWGWSLAIAGIGFTCARSWKGYRRASCTMQNPAIIAWAVFSEGLCARPSGGVHGRIKPPFFQLPCTTPPSPAPRPRPHAAPCSALCCAPALLCACSAPPQKPTRRAKKPNKTPAPAPRRRPRPQSNTGAARRKKPPPSATGACTANAGDAPTLAHAWATRAAKPLKSQSNR